MKEQTAYTYATEIRHRHESGLEHAHAGCDRKDLHAFLRSVGQIKPGDTREDYTLGDAEHGHSSLRFGSAADSPDGVTPSSGPVVWSERLERAELEAEDRKHTQPEDAR